MRNEMIEMSEQTKTGEVGDNWQDCAHRMAQHTAELRGRWTRAEAGRSEAEQRAERAEAELARLRDDGGLPVPLDPDDRTLDLDERAREAARVLSENDDVRDRVLVNDEKTVLVNIWSTGEVEVAFRDDPGAMWSPPIRVAEDDA